MASGNIAWEKRGPVIRQAISCDICGRDKQQTNHWFVVYEHGAELRISGWNAQVRMSMKAKHLCGQTCLHKLVDDFMAHTIAVRIAAQEEEGIVEPKPAASIATDMSLTSPAAHAVPVRALPLTAVPYHDDIESSARVVTPESTNRTQLDVVPAARPAYNSRAWRAEAWKREQEREKRAARDVPTRRRSIV